MQELFAKGGAVARTLKPYESRPEQVQMSLAVEQALEQRHHLIVEAGTGVGKSLAYLLPAAVWAVRNGKKVVVATYTRLLQQQLMDKDLPVAQRVLSEIGLELKTALLM